MPRDWASLITDFLKAGKPAADLPQVVASAQAGAIEGTAWELVGIASYPVIDKLSVYGKLGAYRGELEGLGEKETNADVTYGLGLQYDVLQNVGLRGEWQRYNKMGGGNMAETDVDVLSVGVVYRFQ